MHNHCINKLINIEEVIVKNVIHAESFVKIMLETKPKEHISSVAKMCNVSTASVNRILDTISFHSLILE